MVAPVSIPYDHFASVSFDLRRFMSRNDLYGGITQVREAAVPRWVASYRTALLSETQRRSFKAFWDSLRGGLVPFLGYDPSQSVPAQYVQTGLPSGFSGATTISSISAGGFTVGSLPSGFVLTQGDLIELAQGDNHGLFRIMFTGSGTSIPVVVEPQVPTSIFTSPTGNVLRPACNMIVDPSSWQHTAEAGTLTPASFSAIQKVY